MQQIIASSVLYSTSTNHTFVEPATLAKRLLLCCQQGHGSKVMKVQGMTEEKDFA